MADRWDVMVVLQPQTAEAKARWYKIGAAFANKAGGINIELAALPAPTDQRYRLVLLPAKEYPAAAGQQLPPDHGWNQRPAPGPRRSMPIIDPPPLEEDPWGSR